METSSHRRAVQQALADWRAQDQLGAEDCALAWAPTMPTPSHWHQWLDRTLLILGTALLCAGVIVFFAFNWQALHKFTKFGLLAAVLTALAALAALRPTGDMAGRAALAGAQVMGGVLLAVIGQTYQTGADAWQLFALWTLLAVPWALAARAAPHWWLPLVVGNVALLRYCSISLGVGGMFELLFSALHAREATFFLLAASVIQLVLWYLLATWAGAWGFRGVTGPRLIAVLAIAYAAWVGLASLMATHVDGIGLLVGFVALVGLGAWFRWRVFDIVVLSLVCLAGIGLVVSALGRLLFEGRGDFGAFLLLALVTIGLAAAAAAWLLRVWRDMAGRST
ncbi:DUF2157 domain-containing protein [Cupriavidus sp. RAF12]|uniref:DUF2157 domain-containing protein n=1 Tax=Cupriavidus sp. RAF12 TaxID=3233050 RepID=UPI003F90F8F3